MDQSQMRYLRTILKYLDGPIRAAATDKLTAHTVQAIYGVLSRVIVGMEDTPHRLEQLRTASMRWLTELKRLLPRNADVDRLQAALDSADAAPQDFESALSMIVGSLAARNDAVSHRLHREIVELDWQKWQKIEHDHEALLQQPALQNRSTAKSGLTAAEQQKLLALLRRQCGESPQLAIANITVVPGGFSKQTLLIDLYHHRVLPKGIVVRVDRPESPLGTTVVSEYPLLKVLHESGVKVPQPWLLDAEGAVTGGPLMVVSRSSGSIVADGHNFFDKQERAGCALELAHEIAKYHAIPLDRLLPETKGMKQSNVESMRAELETFRAIWVECGLSSIVVEAAFDWMFSHLEYAGTQRSLIHGDMRFHNILVEGDNVMAILDWETSAIGNPAFDLSYAYHHVTQLVSWHEFLDAYAEAGGIVPSAETLNFYALRTEMFITVYLSRMEAGFLSGMHEKIDLAYAGMHLRQHTAYLLARRLQSILDDQPL